MSSEATSVSICDTISNSAGLTSCAEAAATFTTASPLLQLPSQANPHTTSTTLYLAWLVGE
jgi:hypothetical protein